MGIYSIKPRFQAFLRPVAQLLIRYEVHPTYINLLGLVLSVLGGGVLFVAEQYPWLLLYIPFMAFVRTACNALDGMVARALEVKNQGFGEVLNEFLDRVSDAALFLGLAFAPYTNVLLGVAAMTVVLLNSYLSIVSKAAGGSRQYGGVMGKADRMIYLGVMAIVVLVTGNFVWADALLGLVLVGTLITLLQRFIAVRRELVT